MTKQNFIGRDNELNALKELFFKKSASLVVIRGRRRIGKSRLVQEFAKGHKFLWFSGIPIDTKVSAQDQRDEFSRQLSKMTNTPDNKYEDWSQLFSALASQTSSGKVIILFDEISWMGADDHLFLPKLKNAWDMEFKQNPELILILCGSVSSWIEKNILNSTGFVGRLSLLVDLLELSIFECNLFIDSLGHKLSSYEKFKILSVTGGVPRYLEEIKPQLSAEENIKKLCFTKSGILFREFNDIFSDIFTTRAVTYKKIIESLIVGKKELSEIAAYINMKVGGNVSEYLKDLLTSGFIKRDYTWNIKSGKASNLCHYRLSDNYLRFYLKYIEPNSANIEAGLFENQSMINLPGYNSIMGYQFENLVLNNRKFIWKALNIYQEEIVTDNPYFQRAQIRKKSCQIDYLIQLKTNVLYLCEIKFYRGEVKADVISDTEKKINALSLPRGFAVKPVLIYVNGISEDLEDKGYYYRLIDFSKALSS
jgi:AAA+ ATPase superfamily predicted ATPase